jgi:hypothetical protein
MHRLGRQYGISGNGLKKICRRLTVPYPPRGYWAKLAAGKRVKQTPLPSAQVGTPTRVTITPTPPPAALARARTRSGDHQSAKCGEHRRRGNCRAGDLATAALGHRRLDQSHERDLAAAKRDRLLWGREFGPKPFTPLERRQQRFLSTLLKEAEKRSYKVNGEAPHRLSLEIGRNTVEFTLHEHIRQVRRLLTDEEKAKAYSSRQRWRQERIPTGALIFALKTFLVPGLSKEWRDGERPLDAQIGEIIAVLTVAIQILEKRRLEAEAAERRRWQEEARRREERDRQARDRNRWRRFIELAKQWKDAQLAGCFLDELKRHPCDPEIKYGERTLAEWISWAEDHRNAFDPGRWSVGDIWGDIESVTALDYPDCH